MPELEQEELAAKGEALRALMGQGRGRLSEKLIMRVKDDIAKIMDPLPPPWKWEQLRQIIGLDASEMAAISGFPANRIRFWEKSGGTLHPENWIRYAVALDRTMSERGNGSGLASLDNREIRSDSVRSLIEVLRSTANSLRIWTDQEVECDPEDLEQLWEATRLGKRSLLTSEIALRKRVQQAQLRKEGTPEHGTVQGA